MQVVCRAIRADHAGRSRAGVRQGGIVGRIIVKRQCSSGKKDFLGTRVVISSCSHRTVVPDAARMELLRAIVIPNIGNGSGADRIGTHLLADDEAK